MSQERDDETPQSDKAKKSKLERMGIPEPEKRQPEESPREGKPEQKKSKTERTLGDSTEVFVDPNHTKSKSTVNFAALALGKLIASVIQMGRETISSDKFKHNLSMEAGGVSHAPLSLTTEDGAKVSGIKVEANPPSDKTIIVFQGQKGNFQDQEQLRRIFEIARETGANVVAFNYREKPSNKQNFINDAMVATNYVMSRINADPTNITFYGESFGGTVAAETAAQLKENSNIEVNILLSRTPKSLSEAVTMIDPDALLSKPAVKLLHEATSKINKAQFVKNLLEKNFGGDFEAQEAINKLDPNKVKCLRVEGDKVIHEKVNVKHKNMSVCTTKEEDKHNAPLSSLSDRSTKWVRAGQQPKQERQNGLDILREHANPGFKREEHITPTAKAE